MLPFSQSLNTEGLGLSSSFNYYSSLNAPKDPLNFNEFIFPPIQEDHLFLPKLKEKTKEGKELTDFYKGTTTLAFVFKEGIIMAVDSRASMGSFMASETVRKVIEINDYLLGTMAGGAADCFFWERYIAMEARIYELKNQERLSVASVSKILSNIMQNYRNYGLSMGIMIGGCDKTGVHLYHIDDDGTRLKGNIFSVGSGSTQAYGVLDSYQKWDLSLKDAVYLGMKAIQHATHRDSGSGGVARVYHVHEKGWTKIQEGEDVNMLHYKFSEEKGMVGDGDESKSKIL